MTIDVAELARTNQPLPSNVSASERLLYYTLRGIYRSYAAGELSLDQAKREKNAALRDFESNALGERIWHDHARRMSEISRVLAQAEKCGCEYCKQIARIFDGRQRTQGEEYHERGYYENDRYKRYDPRGGAQSQQ